MAKACACQGSANTGPPSSRGSAVSAVRSGWFKVILPQVDVDRIPRRRLGTPQLLCTEANGVNVLRLRPQPGSARVLEHLDALIACDHARPAAGITRQT